LPKTPWVVSDLVDQCVLIAGVGREGNAMATRLLGLTNPPHILALDGAEGPQAEAFREQYGSQIDFQVVDPNAPLPPKYSSATVAIMSPGIPHTSPLHAHLLELSIPLTSGSALSVAEHHRNMVGVTGSKGKSTTATLVHALLQGSGVEAALGGNMGIPLQGLEHKPFYVAELSSYQCHYLEQSPDVVALTALFPEHLDWHGSREAYYASKLRILSGTPRTVVANADDDILVHELSTHHPHIPITWVGHGQEWHLLEDGAESWLCRGDHKLFHTSDSQLLGRHNHQNMLIALATASATGLVKEDACDRVLRNFTGLAHRLEHIEDPTGVVFVNDSLATNPNAAAAALRSLSSPGMVWIVGGQDRGVDYQLLVDQVLSSTPRHILGLPESGAKLVGLFQDALSQAGLADVVSTEVVPDMKVAVTRARALASPGDVVLLSPAAPSFGQYRDYQHRAEDFRSWIEKTRPKEHQ